MLRERTSVWFIVLVVAVAVLLAIPSGVVAFTAYDEDQTPRYTLTFCVESAPDSVGVTQGRVLLANARAHWHAASGQDTAQALSLTQDDTLPCAAGSIRILDGGGTSEYALTNNGAGTITFYGTEWWDGTGSQGTDLAYEGVLVHEMGHTFGIHHAGDANWSYDEYLPTMNECGGDDPAADTAVMDSIQQDDRGGAAFARGGTYRYWNSNPGFESGLTNWAYTVGVTTGASYARTGALGVRMGASGDYVYMTSVYDPWVSQFSYPPGQSEMPGMDTTSPTLHVLGSYRHPSSGTTGGVQAQYNRRFLRYDGSQCKRVAFIENTAWSGVTDLTPVCGDPGTAWAYCDRTIVIDNSLTNDATVFRVYIRSTSSAAVYVDKVGVYGGTTP